MIRDLKTSFAKDCVKELHTKSVQPALLIVDDEILRPTVYEFTHEASLP